MNKKLLLVTEFNNKFDFSNELLISLNDYFKVEVINTKNFEDIINKSILKKIINRILLLCLRYLQINLYYLFFGRFNLNKFLKNYIKNNNFDLIILTKCSQINPIIFKKNNIKYIYYFFDTFQEIKNLSLFNHVKYSHKTFLISKIMVTRLSKLYDNIYYCPQFINKNWWNSNGQSGKKTIDVLFVGSKFNKRNKVIKHLLQNGVKIVTYGLGWKNSEIYGQNLLNLFNKSKIVLNFTRDEISYSLRVYQVMASNSFLLSSFSKELINTFILKEHFDYFNDEHDCLNKIKYYLGNEKLRNKIAFNTMNFVNYRFNHKDIIKNFILGANE